MKKLTLFYSTCPNDVFMFAPLVKGWLSTRKWQFEVKLYDIAELNSWALKGVPDVVKFSFAIWNQIQKDYLLLESGAALGEKLGPLLILPKKKKWNEVQKIAIPGKYTTAFLLLRYFLATQASKKDYEFIPMLFSEIMPNVQNGVADAGVIIHEGRFVFQEYNLICFQDLGTFWEKTTHLPIPLGGIALHKRHSKQKEALENALRKSILYAFQNKARVFPELKKYAQEMSDTIIWKHVTTYVNKYSLNLGEVGKNAITKLAQIEN